MPIKKYESKFARHSMPIRIGRKIKRVEFTGGVKYPKKRGGIYITSDPTIQKALERNGGFKTKFKCVQTTYTRAEQEAENKKMLDDLNAEVPTPPEPIAEEVSTPEPKGIVVEEVTKFQEAKSYFIQNHRDEFTLQDLRSKALVREVAKKKGVSFPNWPEE